MKRPSPLHSALRKLVAQAHAPGDARLRALAGKADMHDKAIPEQDDESSLHSAIADELHVDGRPRGMEHAAKMDPPRVEHNPAGEVSEPPANPMPDENETGMHEAPDAGEESPMGKRKKSARFY